MSQTGAHVSINIMFKLLGSVHLQAILFACVNVTYKDILPNPRSEAAVIEIADCRLYAGHEVTKLASYHITIRSFYF